MLQVSYVMNANLRRVQEHHQLQGQERHPLHCLLMRQQFALSLLREAMRKVSYDLVAGGGQKRQVQSRQTKPLSS